MNAFLFFQPMHIIFAFVLILICANANERKLVIDHDGGTDDVTAIFEALLYEKYFDGPNVVALTTLYGNTDEYYAYYNSQRVLKIAQRQDVPIYRGAPKSTVIHINTTRFFGYDGLGEVSENFTDLVPARQMHAVNALIELSKEYEGKLTVVAVGPATNIALAVSMDPEFLGRLEHFYIGDGYIYSDAFPDPGFNLINDVEAYYTLMENATPDKVTILPFSQVQLSMNISWDWREDVFGTIDSDIIKALNRYEAYTLRKEPSWYNLDPALVAQVLDPTIVSEYRYYNTSIILCGYYRGINTNVQVTEAEANVRMIYSGDRERYRQFLYDVFSADATSSNVTSSIVTTSDITSAGVTSSNVTSSDVNTTDATSKDVKKHLKSKSGKSNSH